jgi:acyl-CoA synthetase (NDP forming)
MAVIAVPAAAVVDVASDCARKGVRRLVVVSAGFAEVRGHGVDRQRELLEVCRAGGMRLVGPNCLGVLNTVKGLNATFAPTAPPPGGVGFMSQSGGLGIAVIDRARELGSGFRRSSRSATRPISRATTSCSTGSRTPPPR